MLTVSLLFLLALGHVARAARRDSPALQHGYTRLSPIKDGYQKAISLRERESMAKLTELGDGINERMDKWISPSTKYLSNVQSGEIEGMIKDYLAFLSKNNLYPDLHRAIWKRKENTTHVDGNYSRSGAYNKGKLSIKLINWGDFRKIAFREKVFLGPRNPNTNTRRDLWANTYPGRNSMSVGHSHGNCFAAIVNGRGYQQPLKEVEVDGQRWAKDSGREQVLRAGDVAYADDSRFLHNVYTKTNLEPSHLGYLDPNGYMNNLHFYYDNGDGGKYIRHYKREPVYVQGRKLYPSDDDGEHDDTK